MNDMRLYSHMPTHTSICLGMLLLHVQNFICRVNCMPTLQQVCSVILLQIIHLQLHEWKWALQILVDIDYRHCYIGQNLFSFKFELFSLVSPYPIQTNCLSSFPFFFSYATLKNVFYSFPSVLITSSLIMHFSQKIQKRYTSVAFTGFCLPLFERSQQKSIT